MADRLNVTQLDFDLIKTNLKEFLRQQSEFEDYDFDQIQQDEIIDFMTENQNKLREVSLRMAIKIAQLRKSFPLKWSALALSTCMKSI